MELGSEADRTSGTINDWLGIDMTGNDHVLDPHSILDNFNWFRYIKMKSIVTNLGNAMKMIKPMFFSNLIYQVQAFTITCL